MKYLVNRKCPACDYEYEFVLKDFFVFRGGFPVEGEEKDAKNYTETKDFEVTKGSEPFRLETNKSSDIRFGGPCVSPSFEKMICPGCGVCMENRAKVTKIK